LGENQYDVANQSVMESAMNRASMMGTSLALETRLTSEGGYYAGYNPRALNNPQLRAMAEANLQKVLAGSNVSNFATENASGDFARTRMDPRTGIFEQTALYAGEYFGRPLRKGARGADRYAAWRAMAEAQIGSGGQVKLTGKQYWPGFMKGAVPSIPKVSHWTETVDVDGTALDKPMGKAIWTKIDAEGKLNITTTNTPTGTTVTTAGTGMLSNTQVQKQVEMGGRGAAASAPVGGGGGTDKAEAEASGVE